MAIGPVKNSFQINIKMSIVTHTHPQNPEEDYMAIYRLTAHFIWGVMSELMICKHGKEYGYTWHRMPLPRSGVTKQHKTQTLQAMWLRKLVNSYSASHDNWCTATLWNRIMTAQCEGMGEVGSARYEPALLPPCPSIRVLSYSNCQEIHSRQQTGLAV